MVEEHIVMQSAIIFEIGAKAVESEISIIRFVGECTWTKGVLWDVL